MSCFLIKIFFFPYSSFILFLCTSASTKIALPPPPPQLWFCVNNFLLLHVCFSFVDDYFFFFKTDADEESKFYLQDKIHRLYAHSSGFKEVLANQIDTL